VTVIVSCLSHKCKQWLDPNMVNGINCANWYLRLIDNSMQVHRPMCLDEL